MQAGTGQLSEQTSTLNLTMVCLHLFYCTQNYHRQSSGTEKFGQLYFGDEFSKFLMSQPQTLELLLQVVEEMRIDARFG